MSLLLGFSGRRGSFAAGFESAAQGAIWFAACMLRLRLAVLKRFRRDARQRIATEAAATTRLRIVLLHAPPLAYIIATASCGQRPSSAAFRC